MARLFLASHPGIVFLGVVSTPYGPFGSLAVPETFVFGTRGIAFPIG
jgi:hypothetical protein